MKQEPSGIRFKYATRILTGVLICALLFFPGISVFAQIVEVPTDSPNNFEPGILPGNLDVGAQADYAKNGGSGGAGGAGGGGGLGGAAGSAAGCIGAAQAVRSAKEAQINSNPAIRLKVSTTHPNENAQTGELGQVSFDAVGYCLINAMIQAITQGVKNWGNTAISGNPAFVNDPEKFFNDLGNQETNDFVKGLQGNKDGLNISSDLKTRVIRDIAQGAHGNKSFGQSNGGGLSNFWNSSQVNGNNYIGATLDAGAALAKNQMTQTNLAGLDLLEGGGFLSARSGGGSGGSGGSGSGNSQITVPGSVLNNQFNDQLSSGRKRLNEADKFDQVVSQLVQALIKIILSQVLN